MKLASIAYRTIYTTVKKHSVIKEGFITLTYRPAPESFEKLRELSLEPGFELQSFDLKFVCQTEKAKELLEKLIFKKLKKIYLTLTC